VTERERKEKRLKRKENPLEQFFSVFVHAAHEVIRHANVENIVVFIGHDVDVIVTHENHFAFGQCKEIASGLR
jgi:hypothetical protein